MRPSWGPAGVARRAAEQVSLTFTDHVCFAPFLPLLCHDVLVDELLGKCVKTLCTTERRTLREQFRFAAEQPAHTCQLGCLLRWRLQHSCLGPRTVHFYHPGLLGRRRLARHRRGLGCARLCRCSLYDRRRGLRGGGLGRCHCRWGGSCCAPVGCCTAPRPHWS